MKKSNAISLLLLLFAPLVFAGDIIIGEKLPEIQIGTHRGGELILKDGEVEYLNWDSNNLIGKTRVIYHLAARMGIDKVNQKSMDALDELHLPKEKFTVLTVINADDVFMGGGGFAKKEVEKNRKIHTEPEFVLDKKSNIQRAWNLKRKSSAIIIVDENNIVLFFKDGRLSDEEHEAFLNILRPLNNTDV